MSDEASGERDVRFGHTPVLAEEVSTLLAPVSGDVVLDCTAGLGGHAAILGKLASPGGIVVLNDLDRGNLERAAIRVREEAPGIRVEALAGNFASIPRRMVELGLRADVALADLGFSSSQMDDPERGLSFMRHGPLDMRFDQAHGPTAADLIHRMSESELGEIIREFGEERRWRGVAQKLVAERGLAPINTTQRLADLVRSVVPPTPGSRIDPATRTFQALRIAVNDELGNLRSLLDAVERAASLPRARAGWLALGARVGIVSFHSLEDRMVKRTFGELVKRGVAETVQKGVVSAGEAEQRLNPRSRSAKLRVIRLVRR